MNVGTAGKWDLKWKTNITDSRWYTTLYSKTGQGATNQTPPVCNTTEGVDMEGMEARTVIIKYEAGSAAYIAVYLKGIWSLGGKSHFPDSTNRGAWFKLRKNEQMIFSLGPCGLDGNSHTPLGNCNRGIIEIEIDQSVTNKNANGYFAVLAGGYWT